MAAAAKATGQRLVTGEKTCRGAEVSRLMGLVTTIAAGHALIAATSRLTSTARPGHVIAMVRDQAGVSRVQ